MLVNRRLKRKRRWGREKRSSQRIIFISVLMKRCCLSPASWSLHQRWGSQISSRPAMSSSASSTAMISNTCVAPPVGSGSAGTPSRRTNRIAKLFSLKSSMRLPRVLSPSLFSQCSSSSLTFSGSEVGSSARGVQGAEGWDDMSLLTCVGVVAFTTWRGADSGVETSRGESPRPGESDEPAHDDVPQRGGRHRGRVRVPWLGLGSSVCTVAVGAHRELKEMFGLLGCDERCCGGNDQQCDDESGERGTRPRWVGESSEATRVVTIDEVAPRLGAAGVARAARALRASARAATRRLPAASAAASSAQRSTASSAALCSGLSSGLRAAASATAMRCQWWPPSRWARSWASNARRSLGESAASRPRETTMRPGRPGTA